MAKRAKNPAPHSVKPLTDEERADVYGNRMFGRMMMLVAKNQHDLEICKHNPLCLVDRGEGIITNTHVVNMLARICGAAWEVGGWRRFFLGHRHPDYRQGIEILNAFADSCLDDMLSYARYPPRSTSALYELNARCEAEASSEVWVTLRGDILSRGILMEIEERPFNTRP